MPRGSEELTNARKEEIINACASLYEHMGFKDISIRDIGAETSFTRTSIYNYFQTKEEIFLALLQREYETWFHDLESILHRNEKLTVGDFADRLAHTLENRECMLKLMSMNLYDMEGNSRMDNLVAFKRVYADAFRTMRLCMEKYFPEMSPDDVNGFLYAFFPFMFGVYPYTKATDKQLEAMEIACVENPRYSIYGITRAFVEKMLGFMNK